MDVRIGCEAIVAVSQPSLNIFHGITQVHHDRGATMSEIVEANFSEAILYKQLLKFLADEVRLEQHTDAVHTYKISVILVIGIATQLHLRHLLIA